MYRDTYRKLEVAKKIHKIVYCDACENEIKIKMKVKRVGRFEGEVIKFNYFECKGCKHKYFVSVDSARIREIQREIKANMLEQGKVKSEMHPHDRVYVSDEIVKLQKKAENLKIEIEFLTQQMKKEFEGWEK